MGDAKFYFYPADDGFLRTIDFGEPASDLQEEVVAETESSRTYSGGLSRVVYGKHREVRVVLERFADESLAAKLESMLAHLYNGHPVSFTADKANAWAGFTEPPVADNRTTLTNTGNIWSGYESVTTMADSEYLIVQSANPEYNYEKVRLSSSTATSVTLARGLYYEHNGDPVLIRHHRFHPFLYLPQDQIRRNPLTHDHGINWTFDITLAEAPEAYAAFAPDGWAEFQLNTETEGQGDNAGTLQQIYTEWRHSTIGPESHYGAGDPTIGRG